MIFYEFNFYNKELWEIKNNSLISGKLVIFTTFERSKGSKIIKLPNLGLFIINKLKLLIQPIYP